MERHTFCSFFFPLPQATVSTDADVLAAVNVASFPDGGPVGLEAILGNSITYDDDGKFVSAGVMMQVGWGRGCARARARVRACRVILASHDAAGRCRRCCPCCFPPLSPRGAFSLLFIQRAPHFLSVCVIVKHAHALFSRLLHLSPAFSARRSPIYSPPQQTNTALICFTLSLSSRRARRPSNQQQRQRGRGGAAVLRPSDQRRGRGAA